MKRRMLKGMAILFSMSVVSAFVAMLGQSAATDIGAAIAVGIILASPVIVIITLGAGLAIRGGVHLHLHGSWNGYKHGMPIDTSSKEIVTTDSDVLLLE